MLKKYFTLLLTAALSFFMIPQTFAQETTDISPTTISPTAPSRGIGKQARQAAKEQRIINKQQRQEMKATFKGRLSEFKDARKQAIIQSIDQKLVMINTKRTTQMNAIIAKLEAILVRIKAKAGVFKTQGINTAALDNAIAGAEASVATAKTNITNQAAKEYTITLTTETQAKNAVGQTVSGLQVDLRTVRQSIIAAKLAVVKAATELAKLKSTPSVTTTQ